MFEAQRQGRLSFYMVLSKAAHTEKPSEPTSDQDRFQPAKRVLQLGQHQL